ncbi:MAG: hypothetical protein LBJ39_06925 [Tannerellaceae bacterium]|jgi:CRISPR-associated endoribonuclease Cas6|nr:hypothetical protein [Tannerellaceae bacterium]
MTFRITLHSESPRRIIPVNYQYPLSAALYGIIAKGNTRYAGFLHETGYGKGFKLFTFSRINCPFQIDGDRLLLQDNTMTLDVYFHLPEASENFVKGLFQSKEIDIADKSSKVSFTVESVVRLPDPLNSKGKHDLVTVRLKPTSQIVSGIQVQNGAYNYLSPDDPQYVTSLVYNWRGKIEACYDKATAQSAILLMKVMPARRPFKARLITIKAGTEEETKVKGWLNFELEVSAQRRHVDILLGAGAGLYNAMGCGGLEVADSSLHNNVLKEE